MVEAGFRPDFSPEILQSVQAMKQQPSPGATPETRDLRALLWSSIDNDTSRDLDQIEYTEKAADGSTRLLIGIADVDWAVAKGTPTDAQAAFETTSVYTGVSTFPMLPAELSTDLTSLVDQQDRKALVIELHVFASGEVGQYRCLPCFSEESGQAGL